VAVSDGQLTFTPSRRQGSGQNRSLQQSDALLPVPTDNPQLAAGSEVEIILLRLPDMA
jgi:molybdopterin molybdotransferase